MKKLSKKRKFITTALSALLIFGAVTFFSGYYSEVGQAYAAGTDDVKLTADIYLHNGNPDDNAPFKAENMFPGDSEKNVYCVHVDHSADIDVRFGVDTDESGAKLAEVMNIRVILTETGDVLYEGLIKDFPESVVYTAEADTKTESEIFWQIETWLDTKVGNEYQQEKLTADFVWWIEADEIDETPADPGNDDSGKDDTGKVDSENPETGDNFKIFMWVAIAGAALAGVLLVILTKKAKERKHAEK